MDKETVVVVIGGGLVPDTASRLGWRTTRFNDWGDNFGVLGDRLRVDASVVLAHDYSEWMFMPSGGQGQLAGIMPEALSIADVLEGEMVESGVSKDRIIKERSSGNTWSQLRRTQNMIEAWQLDQRILILSNTWQLPRIIAMILRAPGLDYFRTLQVNGQLGYLSAEDILTSHDPDKWRLFVEGAYDSERMKERIARDAEGVRQIMEGTYNFILRS